MPAYDRLFVRPSNPHRDVGPADHDLVVRLGDRYRPYRAYLALVEGGDGDRAEIAVARTVVTRGGP
jgi:hypothetical protein